MRQCIDVVEVALQQTHTKMAEWFVGAPCLHLSSCWTAGLYDIVSVSRLSSLPEMTLMQLHMFSQRHHNMLLSMEGCLVCPPSNPYVAELCTHLLLWLPSYSWLHPPADG